MSYDSIEGSTALGRPYFLYEFDNGVDTPTRLTSDPVDLNKMSEVWTASPISHSELAINGNVERSDVDFTFPLSDDFARTFLAASPFITTIKIWKGHHSDPLDEHKIQWRGRVIGPKSSDLAISITAENIFSSMKAMGLRRRYQRTCTHTLYQPGCNLNRADFNVAAIITDVSANGYTLTIPVAAASPVGWYNAGVVDFDGLLGFVEAHSGNSVRLLTRIPGLEAYVDTNGSANVNIARGCNLSRLTCHEKFNNVLNFGGFPYFPEKNPFSVSIV